MSTCYVPQAAPHQNASTSRTKFKQPVDCPIPVCSAISMYEQELERHRITEANLEKSVIREEALLRQKDELIQQKDILAKESEHRLLNGLQLITSLLSIQSRATKNAEASAQLTIAANRVTALGRVHRHLHTLDHVESVEFKQYLQKLCHDHASMASNEGLERVLVVEGNELKIPSVTAIPLGYIANELLTNSIKYTKGRVTVRLETTLGQRHALSISDDGPGLPEGFNPAATHGLGMKITSALVKQIGGELQIAKGDNGQGTRFTVLFS
jgi:two-component system, sensor histidine kinase PdtaS